MKKQNRLGIFLIYSVAAHIGVFAFLFVTSLVSEKKEDDSNSVEITVVEPDTMQEIANNASAIVETDSKTANEKLTEKAKYLSEKNNTVEKETRAHAGAKFLNAQTLATPQVANKGHNGTTKTGSEQKPDLFKNDYDPYAAVAKQAAEGNFQRQPAGKTGENSTTNDNLKDVENDLITRLNTREYKYYGYYTRIKNQLNQWWVPQVQQKFTKMMRQGRTIASENSKVTKLVIVLNTKGNLVKVQVMAASGVRDLDDAAIEAFRQAAPFPNPPKGMIESDGTVKIRWDCVVES
jgi:protein TonB